VPTQNRINFKFGDEGKTDSVFFNEGELKNLPKLQCVVGAIINVVEEEVDGKSTTSSVACENGSISA
jgi:hypothetical protein